MSKTPGKQRARRKHPKPFSAVAAVKRNAREQLGQPPPEKIIAERSARAGIEKHRLTLREMLAAEPEPEPEPEPEIEPESDSGL